MSDFTNCSLRSASDSTYDCSSHTFFLSFFKIIYIYNYMNFKHIEDCCKTFGARLMFSVWMLGSICPIEGPLGRISWMDRRCNRCRQVPPLVGDAYCLACSAWEATGRELQGTWDNLDYRTIAQDLLVSVARNVRALRNLGGAQALAAGAKPKTAKKEKEEVPGPPEERPALQRKRSSEARITSTSAKRRSEKPPRTKEEVDRGHTSSDPSEEDEEESDEEEPLPDHTHRALGKDEHRRPPEPDGPPPSHRRQEHHRHTVHPWRDKGRQQEDRKDQRSDKHRRRHRRAGRKHQRLSRLLKDPFLTVHRKLPDAFLDQRSEDLGLAALTQL